jgi:hypothetical protein
MKNSQYLKNMSSLKKSDSMPKEKRKSFTKVTDSDDEIKRIADASSFKSIRTDLEDDDS